MSVADFCRACRASPERRRADDRAVSTARRPGTGTIRTDDGLPIPGRDRACASGSSSNRARLQRPQAGPLVHPLPDRAGRSRSRVRGITRRRRSTSSFRSTPTSAERVDARARKVGSPVSVLIWTTTPWTIPSNLAIAFHPDFDYGAYDRWHGCHCRRSLAQRGGGKIGRPFGNRWRMQGRALESAFPASALRPRFARGPRRVRHARTGHRRRHTAPGMARTTSHGRQVRARDLAPVGPAGGSSIRSSSSAVRRVRRQPEGPGGARAAGGCGIAETFATSIRTAGAATTR